MTAQPWAGVALGSCWAVVVGFAATAHARRREARLLPAHHAPATPSRSPITHLGAAIRRISTPGGPTHRRTPGAQLLGPRQSAPGGQFDPHVPRLAPLHSPGRLLDPAAGGTSAAETAADRRVGWAIVAGLGLLLVAPPLAGVPLAWAVAAPILAARRERARYDARLHDQVPDVVDLVALTTAAGLPVAASVLAIGDRPGGPMGNVLALAGAQLRRGATTGEALAALAAAGPPARPLVEALVQHDRYGTPLLPALDRVAVEARARRRRRAEEAARRLPVTLLFPLVLTVFPAFVLLTVVPLLAGSLGSLSLTTP